MSDNGEPSERVTLPDIDGLEAKLAKALSEKSEAEFKLDQCKISLMHARRALASFNARLEDLQNDVKTALYEAPLP